MLRFGEKSGTLLTLSPFYIYIYSYIHGLLAHGLHFTQHLSNNRLSGEIPSSMSALTSLSTMNLSYNHLSGKIPTGNQFGTFNASVYMGNIGLCGRPLTGSCPGNSSSQDTHGNHLDLGHISLYLAMTIGFVLNLWVVFCVMLFKTSWRIAYFRFVDELCDKIYVSVAVRLAIWKRNYGIRS